MNRDSQYILDHIERCCLGRREFLCLGTFGLLSSTLFSQKTFSTAFENPTSISGEYIIGSDQLPITRWWPDWLQGAARHPLETLQAGFPQIDQEKLSAKDFQFNPLPSTNSPSDTPLLTIYGIHEQEIESLPGWVTSITIEIDYLHLSETRLCAWRFSKIPVKNISKPYTTVIPIGFTYGINLVVTVEGIKNTVSESQESIRNEYHLGFRRVGGRQDQGVYLFNIPLADSGHIAWIAIGVNSTLAMPEIIV